MRAAIRSAAGTCQGRTNHFCTRRRLARRRDDATKCAIGGGGWGQFLSRIGVGALRAQDTGSVYRRRLVNPPDALMPVLAGEQALFVVSSRRRVVVSSCRRSQPSARAWFHSSA